MLKLWIFADESDYTDRPQLQLSTFVTHLLLMWN